MRLIAVGRLRAGPESDLFARYNARLRPKLAVSEIPEANGSAGEIKRRESIALLAAQADGEILAVEVAVGNALRRGGGACSDRRRFCSFAYATRPFSTSSNAVSRVFS